MINAAVAHCIIECGLLAWLDVPHRNEVMPAVGVQPNSAVGIAGMIEFTDETGVQSVLMLTKLGGMRVIF
jgi:hypothetical protein